MNDQSKNSNGREDKGLAREISEYWTTRSQGYSLATRISYVSETYIIEALGRMVNLDKHMKVADMGTGCGLMALWLANLGHDVVAVDNSEGMLKEAEKNANDTGLKVEFLLENIEDPHLEPESYDMIVARCSTWCLSKPVVAYSNWIDALKPGGHLVIVDNNYYLYLFDEDYRRRREYFDMKEGWANTLHAKTNVDNVDFDIIRNMAYKLPLTKEQRPSWDVKTLLSLGLSDIHIRSLDQFDYRILKESGFIKIPNDFIVVAQKPYETPKLNNTTIFEPPVDDDIIPFISDRIQGYNDVELGVIKALADQNRLNIIHALRFGMMSTSQLSTVLSTSLSLTSHNISLLREQGIVVSERSGRETLHRLRNPYILDEILNYSALLTGTDDYHPLRVKSEEPLEEDQESEK